MLLTKEYHYLQNRNMELFGHKKVRATLDTISRYVCHFWVRNIMYNSKVVGFNRIHKLTISHKYEVYDRMGIITHL